MLTHESDGTATTTTTEPSPATTFVERTSIQQSSSHNLSLSEMLSSDENDDGGNHAMEVIVQSQEILRRLSCRGA